jgi:hypothetical protein
VLIIIVTLLVMAPERHTGAYAFGHVSCEGGLVIRVHLLPVVCGREKQVHE